MERFYYRISEINRAPVEINLVSLTVPSDQAVRFRVLSLSFSINKHFGIQ
jgi:hypothetical protein